MNMQANISQFNLRAAWLAAALLLLPVVALASPPVDIQAAAERLSEAIQIRTVSVDNQPDVSGPAFLRLHEHLARAFPNAHRILKREVINYYSLLYTWPGTDPTAKAILLSAHQDVVPIAPDTERLWLQPPFSGAIVGGHIWKRGAWDDKGNLFAMMEAVERLAAAGFQPRQTIYLAFGHDEEMGTQGGQRGAHAIATLLKGRGARVDFALDEGLLVMEGAMKGLEVPAALIGVAEKGYLTIALSADATPGHSSQPPSRSAIGIMSAALARIEQHSMPAAIEGVAREMLESLAPEFVGVNRIVLSNLWLFKPLVLRQMAASPGSNAMLRTTTALTVFHAGEKESTLPGHVEAKVNFRLLPGDSVQSVMDHVRGVIEDDSIRLVAIEPYWAASRISDTGADGYQAIRRAIREVFPTAAVAPGLMVGATDSRYYAEIADQIYRFSPVRARPDDLPRFHGTNERISISNYAEMIRFYHRLLSGGAM